MKKFIAGLVEAGTGIVLIVVPEPATTIAGVGMLVDGVRRIADSIDDK